MLVCASKKKKNTQYTLKDRSADIPLQNLVVVVLFYSFILRKKGMPIKTIWLDWKDSGWDYVSS